MKQADDNAPRSGGHALATLAWFSLFALGAVAACAYAVSRSSIASALLAYFACLNVITFALYAFDKFAARRGGHRVPERVLLGAALIGGSIGALVAQLVTRHKTAKRSFRLMFWLIVLLQLAAAAWAGIYWLSRN